MSNSCKNCKCEILTSLIDEWEKRKNKYRDARYRAIDFEVKNDLVVIESVYEKVINELKEALK